MQFYFNLNQYYCQMKSIFSKFKRKESDTKECAGLNTSRPRKLLRFRNISKREKILLATVSALYVVSVQAYINYNNDADEIAIPVAHTAEIEQLPKPVLETVSATALGGAVDAEVNLGRDQVDNTDIDSEPILVAMLDTSSGEINDSVDTVKTEDISAIEGTSSEKPEIVAAEPMPQLVLTKAIVSQSDSLIKIFRRTGLKEQNALDLLRLPRAKVISVLHPKDEFKFFWNVDGKLLGLEMRRDGKVRLAAFYVNKAFTEVSKTEIQKAGSISMLLKQRFNSEQREVLEISQYRYAQIDQSKLVWIDIKVRRGDTLSQIFRRIGLSEDEAFGVAQAPDDKWLISGLKVGDEFRIAIDEDGKFSILEYPDPRVSKMRLVFAKDDEYFTALKKIDTEVQEHHACLKIERNIYSAAKAVNLPIRVVDKFVDIFDSRVDFSRQLHKGDEVCVIYNRHYYEGKPPFGQENIEITAVSLRQKNATIQGFLHVDSDGIRTYYDENGLNLKGSFLRSPIKYANVTSFFSKRRFHPILKKYRPHRGVDYGAKTGTPIRATAAGRIIKRAHLRGYGKMIMLQHGNKYQTLYAHMSRFGKGTSVGSYVNQGQIIGYVGSTGLSTGPHLHYEFRVYGKHKDPLTYDMPKGMPINEEYKQAFNSNVEKLSSRLDAIDKPQVAYLSPIQESANNH